ncbi:DsbA family oxidoreductase [Pyxidicoccus fallax]|uniref:DsbA family oxidoreductase n=1 Tax=Pyxidicoccus fallax TaxID=394095 RepID=A0A848LMK1_9BACT|nr:DsbA family oxidoreductase [Pyxidicoccus fallax]NMO18892.1 DsbA family oxidoreductase [Pyxidicoccus fallax]NPC79840.1 DsbA family oxidoreductase [Pyxidicoccus fallax]
MSTSGASVRVDVWSDYVCPFCYLELPVLDRLQAEFGRELEVHWRAYELRPAPVPTLDPAGEYLRTTWARAVYPMAEQRGMTLKLPPVQPRSRLALEAAEFAKDAGVFPAFHQGVFRAFFEEGRDIGDLRVLGDIAEASGLDRQALLGALKSGSYTGRVVFDQEAAQRLGIRGVPALRIVGADGHVVQLSGALPEEQVREAIARARSEASHAMAP